MLIKRNSAYEEESSKIAKFLNSIMYDLEVNKYKGKILTSALIDDHTGLVQELSHSDFAYDLRRENYRLAKRNSYMVERSLIFSGILGVDLVHFYGRPEYELPIDSSEVFSPAQKFAFSSIYSHSFRNNIRCVPLRKSKSIYWKRKVKDIVSSMAATRAQDLATIRNRKLYE